VVGRAEPFVREKKVSPPPGIRPALTDELPIERKRGFAAGKGRAETAPRAKALFESPGPQADRRIHDFGLTVENINFRGR
jgi:hypothetical protein